ncbi:hypothetical protein MiSe_27300 [Microseira wollei NIES-4236]|uniref:Uncharacterized protein n=1 Tax=Microseira wollei NIES-4236 TaxID=2530354 RepID=A0AAV3XBG6_9CYAN|nr:hypothetical protein [Microseira wollei]GET37976.1 hypothetical protein MiSe_27300 [Microseira wollei NIES-4236]
MPASFYQVHLAPIFREHIFAERALRFDPRDAEYKRPWDAVLHACKVFAIQMKIQSIASKYGLTYQHGCGCNSHLSAIDVSGGAFEYELSPQKSQRWIRSFIWTMWYDTMSGRLPMIGSREHHRYFAGTDNFKVSRAPTQRCGSVYGQFNGHDMSMHSSTLCPILAIWCDKRIVDCRFDLNLQSTI